MHSLFRHIPNPFLEPAGEPMEHTMPPFPDDAWLVQTKYLGMLSGLPNLLVRAFREPMAP